MKILLTESTKQFLKDFREFEAYTFDTFCDGEYYLKIDPKIKDQEVFVIANTMAPAKNILELTFLLDVLNRLNAKVNIFFVYFAYARQDRIMQDGEALSAEIISKIIRLFNFHKIYILHPHSDRLFNFLDFKPIIPFDFFSEIAKNYEIIASPDVGGVSTAKRIAEISNRQFVFFEKIRINHDQIKVVTLQNSEIDLRNKKVLIVDDMITTGSTVIKAAQVLAEKGAKSIGVAATHGVLCGDAKNNLQSSQIEKIYITNSIEQKALPPKFEVYSIVPILRYLIKD